MSSAILPGAVLGVLGSGQLGRMFALAARRLGYRVHVFSPDRDSPTGQVADLEVTAPYEDLDALRRFARGVAALTFEFENVPAVAAAAAAECTIVRPTGHVLHVAQHRAREKQTLAALGLPVTPFAVVDSEQTVVEGLARVGVPAVLKTARYGYDGKGQVRIDRADEAVPTWRLLGGEPCVLEAFIDFDRELSVVAARGVDGSLADYAVVENRHRRHILDATLAPAGVDGAVGREAREIVRAVLEGLEVIGVLCVEFFLTRDGRLLVNEIAPRPHNSGHFTIDACVTSQFEQQVRAVCGLPLGSPCQHSPAAMVNLLGDLWQAGEPDWAAALAVPGVALHLYGKAEARPGRKMGHLTALASSAPAALDLALAARQALVAGRPVVP